MVYTTLMTVKRKKEIFTWLCFTADEANSTVQLNKRGNPTVVELETSTDWSTWTDYTIGDTITLANVWDMVFMRNKSETDTWFSTSTTIHYKFSMTWKIWASGDITSLLNKNCTDTLSDGCFAALFQWCTSLTTVPELPTTTLANFCYALMFHWCTSLTTVPELPVTTLANSCYNSMFQDCTSLTTLPGLPATTLPSGCYTGMFRGCTNIKLSTTQEWEYQIPYRIPTTGTGTGTNPFYAMFYKTWWTFTWTPTINTTYYTSNTVI